MSVRGRRGWTWTSGLLTAAAGLVELGKALAVAGQPAVGVLAVLNGLVGVVALAGLALVWTRPRAAALVQATAGLAAITLDGIGSPPPRMLPGAALVIAAATAFAAGQADLDATPATFTWTRLAAWVGLGLHLVVGLPFLALGLLAPLWAILVLWAVWGALLTLAIRLRHTRPWLVLVIPPVTAAILVGALSLGGRFLGWTP
ncbi:MAG: hypothetical protein ACRDYX_06965 [Egibacteraceae bacterium]